jgi:hypothetical protein
MTVCFTNYDVDSRIATGVALLDEKSPGWREKVDGKMIAMNSHEWCVLGQAFGSYEEGLDKLGLARTNYKSGTEFGFFPLSVQILEIEDEIDALTEGWVRELQK